MFLFTLLQTQLMFVFQRRIKQQINRIIIELVVMVGIGVDGFTGTVLRTTPNNSAFKGKFVFVVAVGKVMKGLLFKGEFTRRAREQVATNRAGDFIWFC